MGGHANLIPAQSCFNNSPTDSSYTVASGNPVLSFNANKCYTSVSSSASPAPPVKLTGTPVVP
jgi:hypothetical protein